VKGTPRWLVVAAIGIVAHALGSLVLSPGLLWAGLLAASLLFAYLLLRGSRFGWTVVLLGSSAELVASLASKAQYWNGIVGAALIVCLFAPASRQFVWGRSRPRSPNRLQPVLEVPLNLAQRLGWLALARIAGWSSAQESQRSYARLIWRLGWTCLFLLLLVGATYNWQRGSGRGSAVAETVASVTWTCYACVQILFVVTLICAAYHHLHANHGRPSSNQR
jgi:hypothetical protein